jgi:peptidoglycan/xylan/chitin deacetylase (PgdA/CDA1 family)
MQIRPSLAFEALAAVLTAYSFFSLSVPAERKITPPALRTDSTLASPRLPIHTDTIAGPAIVAARELPPPEPVEPVVIQHGPRNIKALALTFDACSTDDPSRYDERITPILIRSGTPATFFLGGKWMQELPEQTKELASNPLFEIGNHSYLHPHLTRVSDERVREELISTQKIIDSLTGTRATLFRPPFGEHDTGVVRIAASLGLRTVQFDLASGDPDLAISKERLIDYVSSMARSGSIIVMHINRKGWHTAEALPEILARLRRRGFVFMTVSDLLSNSPETEQTHR